MGGGKSFNVERMVKENIESAKPKSLSPEHVLTSATSFATGVTQTKETYRQIQSLMGNAELPAPITPELNQLSQSEINTASQKAREEERKRREASRIRNRTLKTGPRGLESGGNIAFESILGV